MKRQHRSDSAIWKRRTQTNCSPVAATGNQFYKGNDVQFILQYPEGETRNADNYILALAIKKDLEAGNSAIMPTSFKIWGVPQSLMIWGVPQSSQAPPVQHREKHTVTLDPSGEPDARDQGC